MVPSAGYPATGYEAIAGASVSPNPSVIVKDENGAPLANARVAFVVTLGGGSVTTPIATTDANGVATTEWKLGTLAVVTQSMVATAGAQTVTFSAKGTAGAAAKLVVVPTTNNQSDTVGKVLANPPSVRITDINGNQLLTDAGRTVVFSLVPAANGIGAITGATASSAAGVATVGSWRLSSTQGVNRLAAASAGLAPDTILATGIGGTGIMSKDPAFVVPANATVATAVSPRPSVVIKDANNNPLPGLTVTFEVTAGRGFVTGASRTTDGSGVATVGSWTLGDTARANILTAKSPGIADVQFTVTGTAGASDSIRASSATTQNGVVAGQAVPIPPSVIVKDKFGNVKAGASVVFAVTSGNGSVAGSPAITDAAGVATVGSWTLGSVANVANSVSATLATGPVNGSPVVFTATSIPGAGSIQISGGNGQSATVNTPVATPPSVIIKDNLGNPIAGTTVTFSTTPGGGSITGGTTTTNAAGIATVGGWILGTIAGENTLTASAAGVGSVTFTAVGTAAGAASITKASGDGQTGAVRQALPLLPSVLVRDAFGNPVITPVTFAVASGGGSIAGGSTSTDGSGTARAGAWTLGPTTGVNTLTATVGSLSTTFSATGVPGGGALSSSAGNGQTATVNTNVGTSPSVLVKDAFNNPIANVSITFTVATGGGSVTGATTTTNASGIATVGSWTLGTATGVNTLTASCATCLSGSPVTFTATGTAGAATTMTVVATTDNQTQKVSTAVANAPSVIIKDTFGNPVNGVSVAFAVTSGNGSVTGSPATTNASGVATVGSWILGPVVGTNTLSATAGALSATFTATGATGVPQIDFNGGNGQTATVNTNVATAPSVIMKDANGNAAVGVSVTFAVALGGGSVTSATATTNASGIATVGSWKLGTQAGANTLTATSSGAINSPVTFTATGRPDDPSAMQLVAGNGQTAFAGTSVATPPSVRVRDQFSNPINGVSVTFVVASGGGSVTGGTAATGSDGIATVGSWTMGNFAGANSLTASSSAPGLAGITINFTATGAVGPAAKIEANGGNGQTATAGSAVATPPSVIVKDNAGNAVSGVSVTFASSTGVVTGGSATTNASGIATVGSWTLSTTAGANTLTATSGSLTGSPLSFTATGTAGPAASIAANAGNGQTAVAGSAVATPPSVIVRDANNNPVSGTNVTFATADGTLTGGSATTNASGIATVGSWTLRSTAGANTMTATSGTLTGSPVTFTATGTPPPASSIALNGGSGQSALAGSAVATAPSVIVKDAFGTPVAGVSITFAVTGGGGSGTGLLASSNASGIATVGSWTLGTTAGANTMAASPTSGSLSGSPVTFTATGTVGPAAAIQLNNGSGQIATAGSSVATAPRVKVTDANGNGVAGVSVTFSVTGGGGSGTGLVATTDANGIAAVGSWTLGTATGPNTMTAAGTSITLTGSPVTFTATGVAGSAAFITINGGNGQTATRGTAVATAPSVRVTDANGNVVAGFSVTFAPASGGGSVTGAVVNTDSFGIATVGSWTLGPAAGANSLTAGGAGVSPVTFTATGS